LKKLSIDNIPIIIKGTLFKTAFVDEEWLYDIKKPDIIIKSLSESVYRPDIFVFRQIIPHFKPKFRFYYEWENDAVIPITDHNHWFKNQIHPNTRNKIRRAKKKKIQIRHCEFTDEFVNEMLAIYKESKYRQGKVYKNFDISFNKLKQAHLTFLDKATFVGAYYRNELIGFAKYVNIGPYMRTMGILTKKRHQDKAPMNLLIDEGVRLCEVHKIPFFVYGRYDYGKVGIKSLQDFKKYNGFEGFLLPRYFVPLTLKGHLMRLLRMHNGWTGPFPKPLIRYYIKKRSEYFARKEAIESLSKC